MARVFITLCIAFVVGLAAAGLVFAFADRAAAWPLVVAGVIGFAASVLVAFLPSRSGRRQPPPGL